MPERHLKLERQLLLGLVRNLPSGRDTSLVLPANCWRWQEGCEDPEETGCCHSYLAMR